ncbi:MAG: hypothetical protein KGN39_08905 [Betaproteobacteria bacterium]|nr:hypothetical protein [Betaproteobacteria bacterium]
MTAHSSRRRFLKKASWALTAIPVIALTHSAHATTNAAIRIQLQYQNSPKGEMSCLTCLEFIPGKTDGALGECKKIPGDDEISPHGYCLAWNTM